MEQTTTKIGAVADKIMAGTAKVNAGTMKNNYDGPCRADCEICAGLGWYRLDIEDITAPRFGKLQPCPNVSILTKMGMGASDIRPGRHGLYSDEIEELGWHNILPVRDQNVMEAAQYLQNSLTQGWGMIYLYGIPGHGPDQTGHGVAKTLLLKTAVAVSLQANKPAAYTTMSRLLDDLLLAYDAQNQNHEALARLEWWQQLPVLCIDELTRENSTRWATTRRFDLLDVRWQLGIRQKAITIIASNAPPDNLDAYLASRIYDGRAKVIQIIGADLRPAMGFTDKH